MSRPAFWGGGEFSYALQVLPKAPTVFGFACWGGESRHHAYEIAIDGEVIAHRTPVRRRSGRVLRVEVKIPERLTEGRDHVRVSFRPLQQGGSIGAIFDVRTLRVAEPSVAHP
jgi:hypothetical protein